MSSNINRPQWTSVYKYRQIQSATTTTCFKRYLQDQITHWFSVAVNYIEFDYSVAPYCRREIFEKQNIMRSTLLDAVRYEIQFFCIHCWQLPFQLSTFTLVSLCPLPCSFLSVFVSAFRFPFRTRQRHCGQQIKCWQFRTQKVKAKPSNWIESRESLKIH